MAGRARVKVAALVVVSLVASLLGGLPGSPPVASAEVAPGHTYTTSSDFDAGTSINVVDAVPDQLQLDETTRTFGFVWVALSARGTVAKIDTDTGEVMGEYWSAPDDRGRDPSRTTVDQDGNVWVGNRGESRGGRGSVVHIGLDENGQCEDRNGNGVIDTSSGLGDVRAWTNAGGVDDDGGVETAADECVIHYVRTAGTAIRHVSVTPDNEVWVGGPAGRGRLELLSSEAASLRVIDTALPAHTGETRAVECCYGGIVDPSGVVWSTTNGNAMLRIDPSFPNGHPDLVQVLDHRRTTYGLGVDPERNVWVSNSHANTVQKLRPDGSLVGTYPSGGAGIDRGIAAGSDGDVWVANSAGSNVSRLGSDGTVEAVVSLGSAPSGIPAGRAAVPTGVAVDRAGKVWATNRDWHNVVRIDPATNTPDLTVDLRVPGRTDPGPYNYSDMTGSTLTGRPGTGTWSVVHDAGATDAEWPALTWTSDVPADAGLRVEVATSDDGTTFGPATEVVSGEVPAVGTGRYLRIVVRFTRASSGESPVLYDLTLGSTNEAPVADAGADRSVPEGSAVTVDGSVSSDPDGDPLSYRWRLVGASGPPITLSSTTAPTVSFAAPDDGTYRFELTVSDGREESTDSVTVTVTNADPVLDARLDAASSGGVSLLSGTFTDPGWPDTHVATVDWGDGSAPEEVPVAAQGTGWGTVLASHVYAEPGAYAPTVVLTDDDGGRAEVTLDAATVGAPVALWAGSTGARDGLWVTGADVTVEGATHSNGDLRVGGTGKTFTGPTTYVRDLRVNGAHTFEPPATRVEVQGPPLPFAVDDYRPGGRAALAAGDAFHDLSPACAGPGRREWRPAAPLEPGLYWVPCDVTVTGAAFAAGPVTIAATGTVSVHGAHADFFAPYVDGVLFASGRTGGTGIDVTGAASDFAGYLFAPTAAAEVRGAGHRFACGIVADTVRIAGGANRIVASDCAPPERTSPPPTLVPRLALDLAQTPGEVLPGETIVDAVTAANAGAVLVVPTLVGVENLDDVPATLAGATLTLERRAVGSSTWEPVPGEVAVTARPNPHPGTTYVPGDDPFAGTVVEAGSLATWAVEARVEVAPGAVAALVDPAVTAAVRARLETAAEPATAALRPLWRFGDDLGPALVATGATLTDASITLVGPDGTVHHLDRGTEPALGALAPGASVTVGVDTSVAVPEPPGPSEPAAAYLARLAALDDDAMFAATHATAVGGVGLIVAPQRLASSTRRLPVLDGTLTGPVAADVGSDLTYTLPVANAGSAPAAGIEATASVDGEPAVLADLPAALPPGGLATGRLEHRVPEDHPGGMLAARTTLRWTDSRGNAYGPVRSAVDTDLAGTPTLTATLVDALAVDADGTGQPSPGDTVRYTATIANTSPTALTGATFALSPDAGSTLDAGSVTTTTGTVTLGNAAGDAGVEVALGDLSAFAESTVTFAVTIRPDLAPSVAELRAQGAVTADGIDAVPTDDPAAFGPADPTVTPVLRAHPALGATLTAALAVDRDGDGRPGPGDTLRYRAGVDQLGNTALDGVVLTVAPDPATRLAFGSVTADRGTITTGNGTGDATVAVDLGSLPTFVGAEVTFDVVIASPLPSGVDAVQAQAVVTSAQTGDVVSDDPGTPAFGDPTVTIVHTSTTGEPPATGPVVEGCSLADGATVTAPTTLTCTLTPREGTAVEDWVVTIRPAATPPGSEEEHLIGAGEDPTVTVEVDPTIRDNGIWIVTTVVRDDDGGTTVDERSVVVDGRLKIGRWSVTYRDVETSVAGIPLAVERTYDTLDRHHDGDFGHGWSLGIASLEVATNRSLGRGGWEQYQCGVAVVVATFCLRATAPRFVTVTWPDGRTETFDLTPAKAPPGFSFLTTAAYTGRAGATSTLAPLGEDAYLMYVGDGNLYRPLTSDLYEPERFRLRAADGTEYVLDVEDGLVEATDRHGTRVTIDDEGIHSSLGPELRFGRDPEGRITRVVDPTGDAHEYRYTDGDLTEVVDADERVLRYGYDPGHLLASLPGEAGRPSQTLRYDDDGRLVQVVDATGVTIDIANDVAGRVTTRNGPDPRLTEVSHHDEQGDVTRIDEAFDGRTVTTRFEHDDQGRVTRTEGPDGTIAIEYTPRGDVARWESGTGRALEMSYTPYGQVTEVRMDGKVVERYRYNEFGDLLESERPGQRPTRYEVDPANGLPTSMVDPAGLAYEMGYDGAGNLDRVTGPTGTVRLLNDANGRPLEVTTEGGVVSRYTYDSGGNTTSVATDGRVQRWEYDLLGSLVEATDGRDGTTTYERDPLGRLLSVTDRNGTTIDVTYDAAGRPATVAERAAAGSDGVGGMGAAAATALDVLAIEYDPRGLPVRVRNVDEDIVLEWDDVGRIASETALGTASNPHAPRRVDLAFDAEGQPTGITALGRTTSYGYDPAGRLATVLDSTTGAFAFEYDPVSGEQVAFDRPNGARDVFEWSEAGDLLAHRTSVGDVVVHELTYDHDPATGLLEGLTDPDGRHEVVHDSVGRLTSALHPAASGLADESYEYDGRSNRTAWTGHPEADVAHDDADRIQSDGIHDYEWDAEGRLLSRTVRADDTTTRYRWDALDRLRAIEHPDGTTTSYRYDPMGRRISVAHDGDEVHTMWAGPSAIALLDGDEAVIERYTVTGGLQGLLAVESGDGSVEYPLVDHLGTRRATLDDQGEVVDRPRLDWFGRTAAGATAPEHASPNEFAGLTLDPTGLYYSYARYYDPATGRFLSEDPEPSGNRYSYAHNAPTWLVDPTGEVAITEDSMQRSRSANTAQALAKKPCKSPITDAKLFAEGLTSQVLGSLGEAAVGMWIGGYAHHAWHIPAERAKSGWRMPDFMRGNNILEVKNAGRVRWSSQMQDYADFVKNRPGAKLKIVTRPGTRITTNPEFRRLLQKGTIELIPCLPAR